MSTTRVINVNKAENDIVVLFRCSSILEKKTSALYMKIAEKTQLPLIKSHLLHIAHDSQKHSAIFEGISESIRKSKSKPKDCEKKLGQIWQVTQDLTREVASKPKMSEEETAQLVEKLAPIESFMGEEYYVLVQAKTLKFLTKEIRQIYSVNLEKVKYILEGVIRDEETHLELSTIKEILIKRELKRQDNVPEVKYQGPDAWIRSLPYY
jgi:rubrerythrin